MIYYNELDYTPIRILHVFSILNRGGAETMVMNYYRQIDRAKVQFDFLVHRRERGAYDDEIESLGGRIYRISPIYSLCSHRRAVYRFMAEHPEYQIIHGHVGELGYFLYKEANRRRIPCVIAHAHNASAELNWKWPFRWILKHLIRKYINTPMTCGSEASKWLFGRKLAEKAIMLNNAIHAERYAYNPKMRDEVRQKMGWENQFVVGDVARFSPQKNHLYLLRLFEALLRKKNNALLVLVGAKEELYNEVASYVEQNGLNNKVEFLGSRDDVAELMQGMDVYCSPSLFEGLSLSMVEAQAAGLRVVTSDNVPRQVQLIPELMEFLPLTISPDAWVDVLLKRYNRRDTFDEIVHSGFDVKNNASWLQEFYIKQI